MTAHFGTGSAIGVAAAMLLMLAACGNGGSAVETRERDGSSPEVAEAGGASGPSAAEGEVRPASGSEVALDYEGRPLWSSTRRYTAEQNAQRAFERNGAAFGARTVEDYVAQAHEFIHRPPAGVETLTRANGDTLLYHAQSNTFAVATREGAPRTLFKPDDGAAYWAEQRERIAADADQG